MKDSFSRRDALKTALLGATVSSAGCSTISRDPKKRQYTDHPVTHDQWGNTHNRIWLGGEYWANPMEDWRVNNGAAECVYQGGNRSIHSLTHQLQHLDQSFEINVVVQRTTTTPNDGGASIRVGIESELQEHRSNCFVQQGFDAGIINDQLVLNNKRTSLTSSIGLNAVRLRLQGAPQLDAIELTLQAILSDTNEVIGELSYLAPKHVVQGNVALVSNFTITALNHRNAKPEELGGLYRFSNWSLQGKAFQQTPEQRFGPILWAMYSLSDSRSSDGFIMKISAFTGPMGNSDSKQVELQIQQGKQWVSLGNQTLNPDGWVATFRVTNWDEAANTPYRLIYQEMHLDGTVTPDIYEGEIRANPNDRPLRMAALTCQNDYAFPYEPVAKNVAALDPDLVFFSGDQIYESHGGFGIIREPAQHAILNYLRKFYQFGWAFREVMRNAPTLCLPDDHDVFQGNIWGEGGMAMQHPERDPSASVLGGYVEPVRMVNAVHRTCVGHHPDAFDPSPSSNGMSTYYGEMVYGDVSFAILADRQWKSGPERINVSVGVTGNDEDPLFINPKFNPDGLALLGKRQEEFLTQWSQDWRGHKLKAVLSQTVFAGLATHQQHPERYLKYDFDSSGWPAKARNRAIDVMRPSKALHICGDTHLGTLSQYGVQQQRDSNWAFCTPAIAAGWPRWWLPDTINLPHQNRPTHNSPQTGEYLDSFGNKVYVYAVANPEIGESNNRYIKAHQKGSGFGFITFDTQARTYTLDAYRFLVDVTKHAANNQHAGWPVTIHQDENSGSNQLS